MPSIDPRPTSRALRVSCALAAALAATPAAADITVKLHLSWHDFAATQANFSMGAQGSGGFNPQPLTLTSPYSAEGTFVFPDSDAAGGLAQYGGSMTLSTCALPLGPQQCAETNTTPVGSWISLATNDSQTVSAAAGQTVDYTIDLPRQLGTISGSVALPAGTPAVQGNVYTTGTILPAGIGNYADDEATTTNPDGTVGFTILNGDAPGTFTNGVLYLPSGSSSNVPISQLADIPAVAPGQIEPLSLPASSMTYLHGTITWGVAVRSVSFLSFETGPLAPTPAVQVDAGGTSGTYDGLFSADSTVFSFLSLSSCDDPNFCDSGFVAHVQAPNLDTTGFGGTSQQVDVSAAVALAPLSGTIKLPPGLTLLGGNAFVFVSDPSSTQFTQTSFSFGADGAIPPGMLVGQGTNVLIAIEPQIAECSQQVVSVFGPPIGAAGLAQDFVLDVAATAPSTSIDLSIGLDGWASNALYNVTGVYGGGDGRIYCNGGVDTFAFNGFVGPQSGVAFAHNGVKLNPRPGNWTFSYTANETVAAGNLTSGESTPSSSVQITVPASGAAALAFPGAHESLVGALDTSGWQLGPTDRGTVQVGALTTLFGFVDGTSATTGVPAQNRLPVEFSVLPGISLFPANLILGVAYFFPSGQANWSTSASANLGSYAQGQQSLPGLQALQIAGVGSWTIAAPPFPPGSSQPVTNTLYSASNLNFGAEFQANVASMKVPAGSYPSGLSVNTSWLDPSGQFQFVSYPTGGEVAARDVLGSTVASPILVQRTPAPATYCPRGDPDEVQIQTQVSIASDPAQVKSLTIGGKAVKVAAGPLSAKSRLPLGTWPLAIVATARSGDMTNWQRFYTVPVELRSAAPLGALVRDGTSAPPPAAGVKLGGTVTLEVDVTSCGLAAADTGSYAVVPSLVDVSRAGQDLALATIDPGGEDLDGDIDFKHVGGGRWTLNLKTRLLGTGTFLMKIKSPDGSLWDALLVVKP